MGWPPGAICRHDILVVTVRRFRWNPALLTSVSSISDSIFLLGGVVNVILFCTIRRVIPIGEVAMGLFTGKVFRSQEVSSGETTWCIGSMETGEKERISANLSLVTSDDCFILRQPKFEIVTPPPIALPDKTMIPTAARTAQTIRTCGLDAAARVGPQELPIPRTRSTQRRPLPREPSIRGEDGEGSDRSSSSHRSSIRRLPPIPQSPQPAALLSIVEGRGTPHPPYCSTSTRGGQ